MHDCNLLESIIYISIGLIIHPIKVYKAAIHAERNNHTLEWYIVNFRFGIKCIDCEKIFLDE